MKDTCIMFVAMMVLNTMEGRRQRVWELYEEYCKTRHLYVPIREILEAKGERIA